MNKIKNWIRDNLLFIETIVLLIFIPLYPKLPLVNVQHTWVYVRIEDFIVLFVLASFLILFYRKKVTLRTPITFPIIVYWLIGAIATIHGVLLIFPTISNVYPNVAFLALLRHIEYLSLFFMAYQGMKDKKFLKVAIVAIVTALIGVIFYGFGQRFLGFPAYLTMNEEFAKGIPIQLSALSRVPSTFAGHYDLAAYLVLIIPILVSLFFGFKNIFVKLFLAIVSFLGFILLFMTVSRVSLFVLLISIAIIIFFQKKKLIIISIPIAILLTLAVIALQPSILNRFKSTVRETDVVVDAKTGSSVGHVRFVSKDYFKDKTVLQRRVKDREELAKVVSGQDDPTVYATSSAILPFRSIPSDVPLVTAINISNGENLPQGTEYTNLYLSPVVKRIGSFFYELPPDYRASPAAQVIVLHGDFIVKRAAAYDLSFTTRTQGEWPRAIEAFQRNILIGSGYGSVSLAVDNNYLRMLGETGLLGFLSFLALFLCLFIYMKKVYPDIDSPVAKSFVLGFGAGLIGLALNATLIDVFEASKIAFILWMLMGITFGLLSLYRKKDINLALELRKVATSNYAIVAYLLIISIILFSPMLDNFFAGDDFSWLRWVADCKNNCSPIGRITDYFTHSDGFFYRPGTKLYFYFMYSRFWLNQSLYHIVSLMLHFGVATLFFFLVRRIFGNKLLAFFSSAIFLIMSGYTEVIFWISATGYLFNAFFGLLGLLLFILWDEKRNLYYYIGSIASISAALLFHEVGVVFPLIIIAYLLLFSKGSFLKIRELTKRKDAILLFIPVIVYLAMRFFANSQWSGGDYSYNILKLPLNFIGNLIGYLALVLVGPSSLPFYEKLRTISRTSHIILILIPVFFLIASWILALMLKKLNNPEKRIVIFGLLFFTISLLPFLGLGNIAQRYSYLPSIGISIVFVMFLLKSYEYLKSQGREIAIGLISVFVAIFVLLQIIQIQQSFYDWQNAGNNIKNFFVSMEASYNDYWASKNVEFHFVNVPIKNGIAWVFPVGLDNAVWFAFKNGNAKVFVHSDLDSAIKAAGYYRSRIVLVFDKDGNVKEVKESDRFKSIDPSLIIPAQ